jgi:zinc protease
MINYDRFTLGNGLRVIVHKDETSTITAFNLLYNVGSRDEDPEKTGFAHLFEHLMFGGSENVPDYDTPLQNVGGENNAFTSHDLTNYYITVPKENLETAFWLESDRMLNLAFSEKSLEVQRNVVIEEYKQRYLNQPYGDTWLLLRPLAYQVHPYKWDTIGKELSHIENAKMDDVKDFFQRFYGPNNAILVVAGNVETAEVKALCEKWFAPIPARPRPDRNLPKEPVQTVQRTLTVERDVPFDCIYMAWHMVDRLSPDYHATDLISDILSTGKASRFVQHLIKDKGLFSSVDAYITGDSDGGLFVVSGHLMKGVKMENAEEAIWEEVEQIKTGNFTDYELEKVKNMVEANHVFAEISILPKAINLAGMECVTGDAANVNSESEKYRLVQKDDIVRVANFMLTKEKSNILYYLSKKSEK